MLANVGRRSIPSGSLLNLGYRRTMSTSSSARQASFLITPAALAEEVSKAPDNVKILDATWFMPNLVPPRDAYKEFLAGPRIKGVTGFWDVDGVADKTHPLGLKHMMPTPESFAQACCGFQSVQLRLSTVITDPGNQSQTWHSARFESSSVRHTWSLFRTPDCLHIQGDYQKNSEPGYGADARPLGASQAFEYPQAYVLDGGLPRWKAEGFPVEEGDFNAATKVSKIRSHHLPEL